MNRSFEWDKEKCEDNYVKHGIDFEYAALIFDGDYVTFLDGRFEYGEDRYISLGVVDGHFITVAHTERDNVTRIISAWKGGRRAKRKYDQIIAQRNQETP